MKKISVIFVVTLSLLLSTSLFGQVTAEGTSSVGILDSQNPEVEVTSPNGSEIYQIGDNVDITWTATDSSFGETPISIYYSTNSGVSFSLIEDDVANTGSYSWAIPNDPSLEVLVRVAAIDSFGLSEDDTSDAVFKIDGPPAAPQNLLVALADHAITISWDAVNEGDMDNYYVYRSLSPDVEAIQPNRIDTVSVPTVEMTDTDVEHGFTYYYVLTAVDSMGNESLTSEEVSGTAYILQITAVAFSQRTDGSKTVDLTYSFTGNPVGTYTVTPYVSLDDGDTWQECSTVSGEIGGGIVPDTDIAMSWGFGVDLPNTFSSSVRMKIHALDESTASKNMSKK